jgi:hypothetical protein
MNNTLTALRSDKKLEGKREKNIYRKTAMKIRFWGGVFVDQWSGADVL